MAASSSRRELAIGRGSFAVFLGWTVGVMVYLAVVAAAAALYATAVADRWSTSLTGVVTVQVPDGNRVIDTESGVTRLGAVRRILNATPGIAQQSVLGPERTRALLEPWLGEAVIVDMPLPTLIDIRLHRRSGLDLEALADRLDGAAPGTTLDDHGLWLSRVAVAATSVARGGWIVVSLVGLVATISVIFAVMSGLSVNRDIVDLLQLMGARDGYVAGRFQRQVLVTALPACLIGGACAVGSVLAAATLLSDVSRVPEPILRFGALASFSAIDWVLIGLIPCAFLALGMVTARISAHVALRRIS